MPVVHHRTRRLSTSSNNDDLVAEIDSLQNQLNTTQTNIATLRGTNNKLNDRIQKLETQLDDNAVHVQSQERDISSLRRQLRISSAEITRLRTEKDVLGRDYEGVHLNVEYEREERRKLMEKVSELEEQLASALHLHVVSHSRVTGGTDASGEAEQRTSTSWLDLKSKLRETENELDAVMQERDWLEGQLEKFIHAKDALDSNFSIRNLKSRTSMSSLGGDSVRSFSALSHRSGSQAPVNRQSLGAELGLEWNDEYDSDAESDSTEKGDNESQAGDSGLTIPKILTTDDDARSVASSSKRDLRDFALRLDTSGKPFRARSRAPSVASSFRGRAPSVAASVRSRMSMHSLRSHHDLDSIPPAPVTATAVFHEIERQHDAKVSKLQNDIVTLSTDLTGEIEILQDEVNTAREERDLCVLEIQRLTTELGLAKARHEDSLLALEAALSVKAVAEVEQAKEIEHKERREVKEIGIQTDDISVYFKEPTPEPEEIFEAKDELNLPRELDEVVTLPLPVEEAPASKPEEHPAILFNTKLEAEIATLREQEQVRLADTLKLKSDIDILTRDLREKDTLLRAEVIRLERDLDDLVRDNRNMKDDAEISNYKVENLADELDRTRELLQIQASERREFQEEIDQLQVRNRELELQLRIRRATPSPVPPSSFHESLETRPNAHFGDMAPFLFPKSAHLPSLHSDSDDSFDMTDDEFALETDSDGPPPSPLIEKRRRSRSAKQKYHRHSKKDKKEKTVETVKQTPKKHSRIVSATKIPTASKIPSVAKSTRKSMTLPRSVSAQLPAGLASPKFSPPTPPPEPQFDVQSPPATASRTRSSTLPIKIPRPSISFRTQTIPVEPAPPPPDKTYWKDLMIGGYALPPHEYNKHRKDMRNIYAKNTQIKVTAKGIETKGRVGTGAGFGIGNYAEQSEIRGASKKKVPRRRTSFSDDEAYTHKERSGWLSNMFKKQ